MLAARTALQGGRIRLVPTQESAVRRTTHRSITRWVTVVALCLGWVLALAGPAAAGDGSLLVDVPGDGVGFTHDASAAFLDVQRLYPGSSGSGELEVRNTSAYDASLGLAVTDLVSRENGCLRPETREPGEGCDADGGELEDWLHVTVSREGANAGELWQGDLAELSRGVELATLPAGATWRLRMAVALPEAATNDTMTDSLSFDTRLTANSVDGTSVVAGPQVDATATHTPRPTLLGGPHVGLPGTGATVSLWMMLLDVLALAVGASLLMASRRSRRVAGEMARPG
jgi:hypothetical protein